MNSLRFYAAALLAFSLTATLAPPASAALVQVQKALPSDFTVDPPLGVPDERHGESIAMHGAWMAVGAPSAQANGGSVSIYERVGAAWEFRQKLTAPTAQAGSGFGSDVDIYESGGLLTVIVGAPQWDGAQVNQGRAYVYSDTDNATSGFSFSIATIDPALAEVDGRFGAAVAVFGDVAAIGEPNDGPTNSGAVSLRARSQGGSNAWGTIGSGKTGDPGSAFGTSVDVSGEYVIVGAPYASNAGGVRTGLAYVYRQDLGGSNAFGLKHTLAPSVAESGMAFGHSVAIWDSNTGAADSASRSAVGAPMTDNGGFTDVGAVIFFGDGTVNFVNNHVANANNANAHHGYSVALDGDNALAGRPSQSISAQSNVGQANTYAYNGTVWATNTINLAETGAAAGHRFGKSVAVAGTLALVGSPGTRVIPTQRAGSVTSLNKPGVTWQVDTPASPVTALADLPSLSSGQQFSSNQVAISATWMAVGVNGDDNPNGVDAGAVYLYRNIAGTWTPHSKLIAAYGRTGDRFGQSVAIDGTRLIVGAPQVDGFPATVSNSGAIYTYVFDGSNWVQQYQRSAPTPAVNQYFGNNIALMGDVLAVAATGQNAGAGAVYVYRDLSTYLSPLILTAPASAAGEGAGTGLSVYDPAPGTVNDESIAVGVPFRGGNVGAAFVYTGASFTTVQSFSNPAPSTTYFGYATALYNGRLAVGAPTATAAPSGAVYVYTGASYATMQTLSATGGPGQFGFNLLMDDTRLLIGAPASNTRAGLAFLYARSGSDFLQSDLIQPADLATFDEFGSTLGLASGVYAVGAPLHDAAGSNIGAAYVYEEAPVVTVTPTTLAVSETGPTSDSFSVSLNQAPSTNVTVSLSFGGDIEVNAGSGFGASPQTLTLTPANATAGVTVQVRAVDDAIDENDPEAGTLVTSATASGSARFNGLAVDDVTVNVSDNDASGVFITSTSGNVVSEDGITDSYSVVLGSAPSAPVSVAIAFDASELSLNGNTGGSLTLNFSAANWNTIQTVTVAAVNDRVLEGAQASNLIHSVNSADASYSGITPVIDSVSTGTLAVAIADNETAALEWASTTGSAAEGGAAAPIARLDITASPTGGTPTQEGTLTFSAALSTTTTEVADLGTLSGTLSFTNAVDLATSTLSLPHLSDTLVEGTEQYQLTLGLLVAPAGVSASATPFTGTILDAQSASVALSAGPLTAAEGSAAGAVVTLTTSAGSTLEQAAGITVQLSDGTATYAGGSGDFGFAGPSNTLVLSFPAGAGDGATQPAPISLSDDRVVEGSEGFTASLSAPTGAITSAGAPLAITINDNDSARIVFALPSISVGEAVSPLTLQTRLDITAVGTGTPSLGVAASANITQTPGSAATPADYTVSTSSVSFAAGSLNTANQPVSIVIVNDTISEGNEDFTLSFGSSTGPVSTNGTLVVTIVDNDVPGISVVQSGGNTAVTEGGATDSLSVVLQSQPTSDVTITLTGSQITPSPTSLSFTSVNWNTPQTVTVTAIDDAIDEASPHPGQLSFAVASSDANYQGFAVAPIAIDVTDNDTAGIVLVESGGTTAVTEGGTTDSYTLVLTSQPTANVSIALSGTQVTASPTPVVFTTANWNTPQTVTVTAIDDAVAEGLHSGSITSVVTSGDAGYNGQSIAPLSVAIIDNDNAAISLVQSGGNTAVTEGGATDSYTLVLTSQPSADVSIALTGTQVTTSPTTVVFTSANWNTPQSVTVTAIDDAIAEGAHSGSITSVVTSSDAGYNGQSIAALSVAITDNDNAAISLVQSGGNTAVTEGGATDSYTLVLTSQPTANVSIALTGTQVTPSPTPVVFTSANWNTPQTVTVAAIDDAIAEGAHSGSVTAVVTSGDANYQGFALAPVNVAITDNDNAGITLAQSGGNTAVAEGGATDSYTLVLTSQPTANVSIALTGTQVTPSPTPVVFTTANWNTPQTVTVTAIDDAIVEGAHTGSVTSAVTSSDTSYQGFALASLSVAITDNDVPGVSVVQSGGNTAVTEGGASDSLTVVLQSQPSANVTITLTGSQITPSPTPLSFTSANWNTPQTVTITAIDDAIDEASPHAGQLSFAVASSDANYQGFVVTPVAVDVTDNDTAGITLVESAGSTAATEGGATDSYTLVLSSQPTANVAIALSVGAQAQVSPGTVSFTSANWNTPQTVTVNAVDDSVVEGPHAATISHGVSSSDPNYSGFVLPTINVAITDNDSAVVNFSAANVSQSEGAGPMAYTVTLSNPVQSGVTLTLNSTNGTAGAADYTPISGGTVSFAANNNASQTVNVIINNDALDEDDETYSLTLSNLVATGNVTLGTATANATILDDDATPTISISSPSQNEGNSGSAPMNFTISLSAVSGRAVSFSAATANGTATAPSDFLALTATPQTIPAGQSSLTLPVTINGDTSFEGDETFSLQLTGISNATPATLSGTGTILEDDQQPTTTVISSDLPDPSVVGESYPVAVTVTAQSSSPTGTVNVSDGSASCTITLVAATVPTSTGSCNLTSTSAGAKTLTASYTASSTNFGNSSGTTTHQVNAAATTISVSGPARSRVNQPTAFSVALAVTAPGAGTPSGTVTLSSGSSSCTATLPATSCNLTFTALGNRTVSVSYAGDGNYASSSSSGAGNTQTLVYALSDLAVTKTDVVTTFEPDDLLVYTVTVRNLGPDSAEQIRILDNVPAGLNNVTWSCDASGGVACPVPGGSGNLDLTIASFPTGGLLNFTFYGNAAGATVITNTALLELPADTTVEDPVPGNNSATDVNVYELNFRDGFEDPQVNAATGSVRIPASALRSLLDANARVVYTLRDARGTALRLYARVHNDRSQYALATRTTQGPLRLGAWQSLEGDPQLSWTAASDVDGWVLSGASLR